MPVKLSTSIEKQNKYVKKAKFCCKGDFCNFKFLPRDCSLKVDGSGLDLRNVDEVMGTSLLGERLSRDLSVKGNESSRLRSVLALQECDAALEQLHHQYEKVGRLCTEKNNHDKGSQLTHDVPYNIVLMARTEKDVINRFLRRYSQGLTDNVDVFGGAASRLIEKLPGHCYKAVQVCTQCYQVYGIIKDACRRCRKDGSIKSSGDHIQTPSITRDNGWLIGEDAISKKDISEVSSFANPPPAVRMTVDAVMLLLNGKTLSWNTCRSIMKNCDSFLSSLIYFEPSKLKKKIALEISRYVRNPYFCPKEIKSISLASSRLCAWVLSVYDRYKVKKGKHTNEFVHDLERKRAKEATLIGQGYDAVYKGSQESGNIERPEHGHFSDYDSSIRKALANRQKRKMNLLSDGRGRQDQQSNSARTLLCNDGVTRIPYKIIGDDTVQCEKISFIVCHDIFDTIDATKMMFMETVRAHRGCQVLLFNYPGQAWTTFPSSLLDANDDLQDKDRNSKIEQVLNNEFIAERLHELLSHVNRTGEFVTKIKPTHLVGIGSGLTVAIKFYDSYCKKDQQCVNIQSIVSINGIVEMEPQLTSILHASLSAFRSYPRDRPDLPVSFFAQFLFSENYFEKVPENLALSIHTAVMNPISLVGRIKLCSGFLKNVSLAKVLKNIEIPFIVLHGTESMLATDDHVKSLTRGRKCVYALMDEWKDNDLGLHNLRENEKDVLVLRVKSGHALWQENRQAVTRLIDHLSSPSEEFITLVQKNVEINLALSNDVETKRNARTQSNDRIDFQSHVERNQQLREISKSNKDIGSAPRVLAKKRLEMNANLDENIVNDDEKEKSVYSQNRQSVSKIVGELTPGSNFVTEGMPKIDYDSFRKDDDEEEEEEEDGWSRVLIRGDAVGAFVAARLVVQLLVRNNNNIMSNKQDHEDEYELFDSDVVLDVPLNRYKQHGAVVGKRGATIAALSADHNVRIHVPHKNAVIYNQHAEGAHGGATTNGYHHGNGGDLHQSQQRDPSLPNVQLEGELDNVETCLIQMLGIVAGKIDGNAVPPVYVPLGNSLSQFNRQGAPLQHQKSKPLSQRYQESSPNLLGNGRTSSSNNHHMNKSVSSNKGTANTLKQPKSGSKKKVANRTATDDTPMDANGSSPNNNKAKSFSESLVIVSPLNATVPSLAQLRQIGRKTSTIIRRKRVSPAVVITEPNQKESGFEGESTNESNSPEGGTTNEFQAGKSKMKATVDSSDTAMEYTITGRDGLKNVQSVFDSIFAGEPVDDVIDAIQRTKRSSKHRQKKGRVADLKVKNNGKAKDVNNENE
mmetsp:Transcript_7159/g.9288  ORF Transcript_7159/g.9288 Transcript_7159/m.9288 type:complete len:1307 (-) Transcript_7159:432-4352(-)